MSWRRIGIYYGLALVFGAYFLVFLWDPIGEGPRLADYAPTQSRFLPFSRESIQELQLHREGQVITCQLDGDSWKVLEPQGAHVTSSLVSSLIENLTMEQETRVVKEEADDLAAYGLKPPHATVILKGKTESDLATVFIGGHNPTSTAVYASIEGSSQVVLLGYNARYYEELLFEAATGATAGTNGSPAAAPAAAFAGQESPPASTLETPPPSQTSQASQEERAADQVPAGEEHSAASVSQSVSQSANQAAANSAQDTQEGQAVE